MLNLNDDMDDLIRQAADEYPLKTDGKDWDKVLGGINAAGKTEQVNAAKYLWLLLLLLPLLIIIPLYHQNKNMQQNAYSATKTKFTNSSGQQESIAGTMEPNAAANSNISGKSSSAPEREVNNDEENASQKKNHLIISANTKNLNRKTFILNELNNNVQTNIGANKLVNTDALTSKNMAPGNQPTKTSTKDNQTLTENIISNSSANTVANSTDKQNNMAATTNDSLNKAALVPQKDTTASVAKKSTQHTTPVKKRGLYAGIAAGLDVTTVKLNEVNKIGNSQALIVGYRINNHWSAETGIMWDNKKYYSPGEYFNKSRTNIPAASQIHYINGICRMFEVPLNVKYDFNSKKKSGFYIAAGLSSYLMKKENYEYYATNNGNYYEGKRTYKNSTNNIFSVANINGGYQFIFKNNNSLRIEPYLKVPLSGLGIGKLPFMSTGISAAYTLPLH